MGDVGVVQSSRVGKGYRSGRSVVIVDVVIDDPRDVQSVEYLFSAGESFLPAEGDQVTLVTVSDEYKVAVAVNSGVVVVPDSVGDRHIYAINGDDAGAIVSLLKSGNIVLNRGENHAVQYEALREQFDELNDKYNLLITTITTTWVPVANDGGAALKAAVSAVDHSSGADITQSEIQSVLVP